MATSIMSPIAVGYIRASTLKQIASPEDQAKVIEAYYNERHRSLDWITLTHDAITQDATVIQPAIPWSGFYVDKATSSDRPLEQRSGGASMVNDLAAAGPGSHVLVVDIDRMFRNFEEAVKWIEYWRKERQTTVHVIARRIRTDNSMGTLLVAILAWAAEWEKTMLKERTKRAMKRAKSRRPGSPKNQYVGYGFKLAGHTKHRRIVPDPVERKVMRRIVRMRDDEGQAFEDIWRTLLEEGVTTSKDKPWSLDRIKRAYQAELDLVAREQETQQAAAVLQTVGNIFAEQAAGNDMDKVLMGDHS